MVAKITRIIKPYGLPLLSGLMIGTTYIPFPPWASLFCFVPLWCFLLKNQDSHKKVFIGGWLTGFVLTLVGFNWISLTVHEFGMMPWPVAILALFAFAGFANLDIALAALAWNLIRKRLQIESAASWALLALLTALFEAHFPSIFEWNYGYTLYWVGLPIYQLAEIFGFQGLSSIVILFNLAALMAVKFPEKRKKVLASAAISFLALNLCGWALKASLPKNDSIMKVGIAQANVGNLQQQSTLLGADYRNGIIDKYLGLSRQVAAEHSDLDFIVWPETAFPGTIFDNGFGDHYLRRLKDSISEIGIPFLLGGYGYEPSTRRPKNAVFAIDPQSGVHHEHYFKTHLLAFGEYIPGVELFPFLRRFIPASEFARGPGPKVIHFQNHRIGIQICYESLFPYFSIGLADQGAQWIFNVTNDSWYGNWQEPYQHLMMTLARAVELRRPLVRATNTGISTVVLANGDILEKSEMSTQFQAGYEIPYLKNPPETLYQKWPWLTDLVLLLILGVIIGSPKLGRFKKH